MLSLLGGGICVALMAQHLYIVICVLLPFCAQVLLLEALHLFYPPARTCAMPQDGGPLAPTCPRAGVHTRAGGHLRSRGPTGSRCHCSIVEVLEHFSHLCRDCYNYFRALLCCSFRVMRASCTYFVIASIHLLLALIPTERLQRSSLLQFASG